MPPTLEERRRRRRESAGPALDPDRGFLERALPDLGQLVGSLPRAFATIFGSPVQDIIDAVKTEVPGGSAGFDDPNRNPRTLNLLGELGLSLGRTALELPTRLGGGVGNLRLSSVDEQRQYAQMARALGERLGVDPLERYGSFIEEEADLRYERPFTSAVEDVGNIAIAGAVAAKPFGMAARSAAGVPSAAPLSRTLRPIKGAPARAQNLEIVRNIAQQGGKGAGAARQAAALNDILGHPYRAGWDLAKNYRTASGQTVGEAVRNTGLVSSVIEKSPVMASVLDPEARAANRAVEDTLNEPKRKLRRQTTEAFDPKLAVDDARQSLYAIRDNQPAVFAQLDIELPDMPRDLAPEQLASALRKIRDAQEAGAEIPPFSDPLAQHRADLTVLTLEAQMRGLDEAALVDFIDPLERFGPEAYEMQRRQTAARAAGIDPFQMEVEWQAGQRYILPERVLGEEVSSAVTDLADDVARTRASYRRWNDPLEQEMVSTPSRRDPTSGRIPEEGTRFRIERDAEGNPITDPETGRFKTRRVAEPDEPVPYEVQGPSKAQGKKLRANQRRLDVQRRRVAKLEDSEATQRAEANREVFEANRAVARRIETLAKEAVAAGDDATAVRLLDEMGELAAEQERLADNGGLAMPKRLRSARQGVEEALDEVIALAATPALRNMLDPETYTKIQSALGELRGAEEFLDANQGRMEFFDRLDEVEAQATRERGQRYPGTPGTRVQRAQQAVQRSRQQVARAQEQAQMLFDPDEAASRLLSAVERYKSARKPYEETLLKAQTRARERLRNLRNTQRRLETAERRFGELQDEVLASIEAQPAPVRDLLRLSAQADEMNARLVQLVEDLDLDPSLVDELALRDLPQDLEQIISEGYDIGYTRTVADMGDDVTRPSPSMGGRVYSDPSSTRRQRGGTAPIESDWRTQLTNRVTDVRVGLWRSQLADTLDERFGASPREVLRSIPEDELGFDPTDANLNKVMENDPHRLERELAKAGYTKTDWGDLFEGKQKRTGIPTFGLDEGVWMRTSTYNVLQRTFQSRAYDGFLREWINPITQAWKNSVLALRPAWHVYSAVGNAILATFQGGVKLQDLMDFLPVATEAWRRHRFDYGLSTATRETFEGALGFRGEGAVARASRKALAPLGRRSVANLEARGIDLDNLPDIETEARTALFEHGITRREIGGGEPETELGRTLRSLPGVEQAIATKPWQTGRKLVGKSYRAAALLDDVNRALVYITRRMAYGDNLEPALARVVRSLGDYQKLSPFERRYVRSVYPFYTWVRHITGVTMRSLGPDSITRTMILAQVMNIAGQPDEMEELLPEWAQGDIHVGGGMFLATRGLNPFADVLGPIEHGGRLSAMGALSTAHPAIQIPFEQVSGISTLSGRPFSTPVPRRDPEGRELPTPPPLSEQLVGSVPQLGLARNLGRSLRGETLTRWGTGEPMLIPGVESAPLLSKVGQQVGFNVRPLDVEAMRAQRIKNRYAEQRQRLRHESQQESYEEETGLPLLPSVLGGRG